MKRFNFILLFILGVNLILIFYRSEVSRVAEFVLTSSLESLETVPNDEQFNGQWHLRSAPGYVTPKISEAWSITRGSTAIRIGIVDAGVQMNHPDLAGHIDANLGHDFGDDDDDPDDTVPSEGNGGGHGTHVAGIAAAATINGIGVAGVCWNATIVPIKAWSDHNTATFGVDLDRPWNLVWAVEYANNVGCDIINMSWGYSQWPEIPGVPSLTDVCYEAYMDNRLLVASAGNNGSSEPHYPSSLHSVMSVDASDWFGTGGKTPITVHILTSLLRGSKFFQQHGTPGTEKNGAHRWQHQLCREVPGYCGQ